MSKITFMFVMMLCTVCLIANTPPVVSNVQFSQATDGSGIVDIYYDVADADGDPLTVTLEVSADNGENFDLACEQITGDVGDNVIPGADKHIIWAFGEEHPGMEGDQFMIAVTAEDNQQPSQSDWVLIPSGNFTYGSDDQIVNLNHDYEIMINEVTNAQYIEYLNAAYAAGEVYISSNGATVKGNFSGDPFYPAGDYDYYNLAAIITFNHGRIAFNGDSFHLQVPTGYTAEDFYDHPVVEVTFMGALAYAEFYDWRLPSDQEWEKAARGMTGYEYPFGDDIPPSSMRCNFNNSNDPWERGTTPVGFYNGEINQGFQTLSGASPYGCNDMCGNAFEWTSTNSGIFPSRKIMRGGSWYWSSYQERFRSWYQSAVGPTDLSYEYGFRCARDAN